jgi:hypothetical protein
MNHLTRDLSERIIPRGVETRGEVTRAADAPDKPEG